MPDTDFELALSARTDAMLDACTRCGKCVEICPVTQPAGIGNVAPKDVISGVLDILRGGTQRLMRRRVFSNAPGEIGRSGPMILTRKKHKGDYTTPLWGRVCQEITPRLFCPTISGCDPSQNEKPRFATTTKRGSSVTRELV